MTRRPVRLTLDPLVLRLLSHAEPSMSREVERCVLAQYAPPGSHRAHGVDVSMGGTIDRAVASVAHPDYSPEDVADLVASSRIGGRGGLTPEAKLYCLARARYELAIGGESSNRAR